MTVETIKDTDTPSNTKRLLLWLRLAPGALQAEDVDHHAGVDYGVVLHVVAEVVDSRICSAAICIRCASTGCHLPCTS